MNAKTPKFLIVAASFLLSLPAAWAQAPPNATGICKDGTYSTAASKDGACRGHKGVQTWYSAATPNKAAASPTPATITNQAPAPAKATNPTPAGPGLTSPAPPTAAPAQPKAGIAANRAKLATTQAAPGGGPGLVWLNGSSNVYHCPGSEFYGKTKTGAYFPEAEAKAKGGHADHNKPCT